MIEEHAGEILPLLLTIVGFFAVWVLNGIKGEIKELKASVRAMESDLRGGITHLDRRVTKVETRVETCQPGRHAQ